VKFSSNHNLSDIYLVKTLLGEPIKSLNRFFFVKNVEVNYNFFLCETSANLVISFFVKHVYNYDNLFLFPSLLEVLSERAVITSKKLIVRLQQPLAILVSLVETSR
jgi:hypothetical protein